MGRGKSPPIIDVDIRDVEAMLGRAREKLAAEDSALLEKIVESLVRVTALVREHGTTIARLRRLFGLSGSEKLSSIRPETADAPDRSKDAGTAPTPSSAAPPAEPAPAQDPPKPKGHGRIPASAYGATRPIPVPHETLHAGDPCPCCKGAKVYRLKEPAVIVRIFGQAPLSAKCWECEQYRCSSCGRVFTARGPEEAQGPKYDETAASSLALLRYGAGTPLNRLDRLQRNLDTPVPDSTQWDLLEERAELLRPAFDEMKRQAAQAPVLHNDDSYVRILEFMGKRRAALLLAGKLPDPERTGLYTTAIVATVAAGTIALFFTGRKHAGENLDDLLALRDKDLAIPLLMSDALPRNVPKGHPVLESNCITHGRRHVVDERENYPALCLHLIEQIALLYKVDKDCKRQGFSAEARLLAHQRQSGPVMESLRAWMSGLLQEKKVEPNSGLGKAFDYFLKRWDKFTVFLRVPGAPLDNNITERALKKAINLRNASLFFRSSRGAAVGDLYMSLIYTAELNHENPFDYLTALQRYAKAVAEKPADWMPWNYRQTLAKLKADAMPAAA